VNRLSYADVGEQMEDFATSGKIQRPLVTVAGTMDALLPVDHHARAYARKVADAGKAKHGTQTPAYRLYEVQNGNHIENYRQLNFSKLEFIQPHAQKAFDLLVQQVERNIPLPPSQCIARGAQIADAPSQPGHCASLFVP
jgi:hypothetical protein